MYNWLTINIDRQIKKSYSCYILLYGTDLYEQILRNYFSFLIFCSV